MRVFECFAIQFCVGSACLRRMCLRSLFSLAHPQGPWCRRELMGRRTLKRGQITSPVCQPAHSELKSQIELRAPGWLCAVGGARAPTISRMIQRQMCIYVRDALLVFIDCGGQFSGVRPNRSRTIFRPANDCDWRDDLCVRGWVRVV